MKKSFWVAFLFTLTVLSGSFLNPRKVWAQNPQAWQEIESKPGLCVQQVDVATIQGFECLFINIARIIVPIAGLALFLYLVIGSFQLLTAGGEAKSIQKARGTITSAIVGIVVLLGIWFILLFIKNITGVDVTKFEIPSI